MQKIKTFARKQFFTPLLSHSITLSLVTDKQQTQTWIIRKLAIKTFDKIPLTKFNHVEC